MTRTPELTREQKIERQGIKESRFGAGAIAGIGGPPKMIADMLAADRETRQRFAPGDLVIARDHPSLPVEVVSVMGQRVFVHRGARSSYHAREIHQTGMIAARAVRGRR